MVDISEAIHWDIAELYPRSGIPFDGNEIRNVRLYQLISSGAESIQWLSELSSRKAGSFNQFHNRSG
jgi:hypothetical protein